VAPHDPTDHRDEVEDIDVPRVRFEFARDLRVAPASLLFGVVPHLAHVELSGLTFRARFGPWLVETPVDNVAHAEITGPYHLWRIAGPARWSADDQGLTFATTASRGVLVEFHEPVTGLEAFGVFHHPNLTVTVADPEGLVDALHDRQVEADVIERDEHDQLVGLTARELRVLARKHDIAHASGMKKDELIEALQAVID